MSHGWRGLVCRSACKPHFHLPIFTLLDTRRALFFLLLTVLQQVVSGKLCPQNFGIALWNSYCGKKPLKLEQNTWFKQVRYSANCCTVIGSYCGYNVNKGAFFSSSTCGREFLVLQWLLVPALHPHKDTEAWCFLNFVLCERSRGEFQEVFLISQG